MERLNRNGGRMDINRLQPHKGGRRFVRVFCVSSAEDRNGGRNAKRTLFTVRVKQPLAATLLWCCPRQRVVRTASQIRLIRQPPSSFGISAIMQPL